MEASSEFVRPILPDRRTDWSPSVKLVAACGPTRPRPASVLAKDSG